MYFQILWTGNWKGAQSLRERINGPRTLESALYSRQEERGLNVLQHLQNEVNRIRRALIASLMHPNTEGHRQYAQMAVGRHMVHRATMTALAEQPLIPQPDPLRRPQAEEPLPDLLARTGLRSGEPLAADIGHQFVDAIRLTLTTSPSSDPNFAPDVYLVLVLKAEEGRPGRRVYYQLNFRYWRVRTRTAPSGGIYDPGGAPDVVEVQKFYRQFEPNQTDEFSVDVTGHALGPGNGPGAYRSMGVLLRDLLGMRLVLGRWPVPQTWLPTEVTLGVNGVEVLRRGLRGTRLGPLDSLDLGYPAPAPEVPPGPPSTMVEVRADNEPGNVVGGSTGRIAGPI